MGGTYRERDAQGVWREVTLTFGYALLEQGETYLLFLNKSEDDEKFCLASPVDGWVRQREAGTGNRLFQADTFDGAIAEVKAAILAAAHMPQE